MRSIAVMGCFFSGIDACNSALSKTNAAYELLGGANFYFGLSVAAIWFVYAIRIARHGTEHE